MALKVAELETVFTADYGSFEKAANVVETRQKKLDGSKSEVVVDADVRDAERALDDVQDTLKDVDGTVARPKVDPREASEGLKNLKDESASTLRESAASFDGTVGSAADAVQEIAANALAGFGAVGALAGLGIAAAIGTAIAAMEKLAEENNALKTAAGEAAVQMVEGTHDAQEAFREYATTVKEDNPWTFWADEATTNIQAVAEALETLGDADNGALRALASGDLADLNTQLERAKNELLAIEDAGFAAGSDGFTEEQLRRADALEHDVIPALQDAIDKQEDARDIAILLRQAEEGLTQAEAEAALAIDEKNRALTEGIEGSRGVAQAEFALADAVATTAQVTADATASEQARREALFELSGNILDLASAQEEASGSTADYNAVIAANREQFIAAANAAGITGQAAEDLANRYGLIPKDVTTTVRAETKDAQQAIERFIRDNQGRTVGIQVGAVGTGIRAMADGGPVLGGTPGVDSVPALLMPNEHVLTVQEVNGLGGHAGVMAMRQAARSGMARFADGGPVNPSASPVATQGWSRADLDYLADRIGSNVVGGIRAGTSAVEAAHSADARYRRI